MATTASQRIIMDLLRASQIPSGFVSSWFRDCAFVSGVLLVPDRELGKSIGKLFGEKLRVVCPQLKIQVIIAAPNVKPADSAPSFLNAKGRAAWKKEAAQQRLTEDSD